MGMDYENIRWLKELGSTDSRTIGRKAARLAQLAITGITVPRGFVVTATEFFNFVQMNNLKPKIVEILRSINYSDREDIETKSSEIKQLIVKGKLNQETEIELYKYYGKLGDATGGWLPSSADAYIAIRCSVVCDDGEVCDTKFIEEEGGSLNIKGKPEMIKAVKETWGVLYSPDVLEYAHKKEINIERLGIGIIIQNMINAKSSGIIISSKSATDPNTVVIEAVYGFGAAHVIKEITPDHYETQKKPYLTLGKTVSRQDWELKRMKGATAKEAVQESEREKPKINTHVLKDLTNTAVKLEEYFGTPQIIEWAIDKADVYIIGSEAVNPNTAEKTKKCGQQKINTFKSELLIKGVGVTNGTVNGIVVNIMNYNDLEKVNSESIIVTAMTDQDMVGAMRIARGVITNAGSSLCHAAVITKDLDKPCIVGTRFGTEQLLDGDKVQINGQTGEVHSIASLDIVDIHPEEDDFLDERQQRTKQLWQEQRELREKGAVIINKKEIKKTNTAPEHIIFNKPREEEIEEKPTANQNVKTYVDAKGTLNIKDLNHIDVDKVKQIVIPIEQIFTASEISRLRAEYPGSVCMIAKEKIKKILKEVKDM
ncbi:MAG: PEP/pyruvate-binding domain-containing protein [archaeon]|jgi:pyruvate,water dikinase